MYMEENFTMAPLYKSDRYKGVLTEIDNTYYKELGKQTLILLKKQDEAEDLEKAKIRSEQYEKQIQEFKNSIKRFDDFINSIVNYRSPQNQAKSSREGLNLFYSMIVDPTKLPFSKKTI